MIGEGSAKADSLQETGSRQWQAMLPGLAERDGSGPAETDSLDGLERPAATDGTAVADRLVQVRDHPDRRRTPVGERCASSPSWSMSGRRIR